MAKKTRLRKEHLQKPKQDGGLNLPDFQYYYWAVNLCCLSFWTHYGPGDGGPKWVEMERLSCDSLSLPAIIGASVPLSHNLPLNNPIVYNSVKIYIQFRKHEPIEQQTLFFPPSVQDATFHM